MSAKEIYKNYPEKVQKYMQNVIDCLKQDYKEIPSSWRVSLDLIADNVDIYLKAKEDIDKNGLLRKDTHGRTFKNQCFPLMTISQDRVVRLLQSFALTPVSRAKMKNIDPDDTESPLDEFID